MAIEAKHKIEKLRKKLGELLGIWELPTVAELPSLLESMTDEGIASFFHALYNCELISAKTWIQAKSREERIVVIRQTFWRIQEPRRKEDD